MRPLYGADWSQISHQRKKAVGWCCQHCGVSHGAWGWRDSTGRFHVVDRLALQSQGYGPPPFFVSIAGTPRRIIQIVLTTAHLDHNPANMDVSNLSPLCQRCHLTYDRPHHRRTRVENARRKMQTLELFG